eukprot:TRINITY_DN43203_c0_g1_i1.p1 TRINITY_DN43203_c0_g1~~TRINITY_DN43203_c0_g1_i1.p1  ORF type:complete len:397 (+),score=126.30 TRINITY_DN43203_c0_g1_i1:75-1265(+)
MLAVASVAAAACGLTVPEWSYDITNVREFCVTTAEMKQRNDTRAAWVAVPDGSPPPSGWPVLFSFVTDTYHSEKCGAAGQRGKRMSPFTTPVGAMKQCYPGGAYDVDTCTIDDWSGLLWHNRIKQYLVSNGVAVLVVNPHELNGWQYNKQRNESTWEDGTDRLLLAELSRMMKSGELGPLDASRVVFRGWSGGAAMVSWTAQLAATGQLGFTMKGGVHLSGGSYNSYATPPYAHGVCAHCNVSCNVSWGQPGGCSTRPQTWPEGTTTPCCDYCAPTDYAEAFYDENPGEWASHPPAFLAQLATRDDNADLCAAQNYHDTLRKHGVESELVLVDERFQDCFCLGYGSDPAAAGSPYSNYTCTTTWKPGEQQRILCLQHAMAFAGMVEPVVKFVLAKV